MEASLPKLKMSAIKFNSGNQTMPVLGFGTAPDPPVDPETAKNAFLQAIELGYRHFDTASLYRAEQPLGEAIVEALNRSLIKSRDEVFITSKLWCSDAHAQLVLPALQRTLKNLNMEYVDLYLIHGSVSPKPGIIEYPIKPEDLLPMDFKSVWAAMEDCQRLGLTESIGVSNFTCKRLEEILQTAEIPPAVNQVEANPCWQQKKLREFCKAKGILLVAFSPLGVPKTSRGSNRVVESLVLNQIAKARGKTLAQIALRWAYEQQMGVVVMSFNKDRMKQNLEIFDWALSKEDLDKISEIPQARSCPIPGFTAPYGPYKTVEELWDGEI